MGSLSGDDTSSAISHDKDTASPRNALELLRQQPTTVPTHYKQTSKAGPKSSYWNFIHTFDSKTKAAVEHTHICLVCLHIKGDSLWRKCLLWKTTNTTRFNSTQAQRHLRQHDREDIVAAFPNVGTVGGRAKKETATS